MATSQASEFTKAALVRKCANYNSSAAFLWGSINFAIFAVLLSDM